MLVYGGDTISLQVVPNRHRRAEWRTKLEEDARRATLRRNALYSFKRGLKKLGIDSDEVDGFNVQIDDLHFIYTEGLKIYLVVECWRCPKNSANQVVIERDLETWDDLVFAYNERHTLCPVCSDKEAALKAAQNG